MKPARWTPLSALGAPTALSVGCVAGAYRQPAFDSARDTISALASLGAEDRMIMTASLAVLGACHVVSALGLRNRARTGRALLALGGVCTLAVAAFPLPVQGGSLAHNLSAAGAFSALALWPAFSATGRDDRPRALRTSAVLVGLLATFASCFALDTLVGLSERLVAFAEALTPAYYAFSRRR